MTECNQDGFRYVTSDFKLDILVGCSICAAMAIRYSLEIVFRS